MSLTVVEFEKYSNPFNIILKIFIRREYYFRWKCGVHKEENDIVITFDAQRANYLDTDIGYMWQVTIDAHGIFYSLASYQLSCRWDICRSRILSTWLTNQKAIVAFRGLCILVPNYVRTCNYIIAEVMALSRSSEVPHPDSIKALVVDFVCTFFFLCLLVEDLPWPLVH